MNLIQRIKTISEQCTELKNKYVIDDRSKIDWICIFTQNDNEYWELVKQAGDIGREIESLTNGLVFELTSRINTVSGVPKILKIRKYDPAKLEIGDVDFTTDYIKFKKKYVSDPNFNLIIRDKFEMLELLDVDYDVRVYFSSIPPSQLRGIK